MSIIHRQHHEHERDAIVRLFKEVFSRSEGQAEGELIGGLARQLFETTPDDDLYCFVAEDAGQLVGSIFFSRLRFEDGHEAFILAPVAVHPDHQGKGIGQALIRHGLASLQRQGVELLLTYGDPRFYGKVGFEPISPERIVPPYPLSQPEGWLGLSLINDPFDSVSGRCGCVDALCDPAYW